MYWYVLEDDPVVARRLTARFARQTGCCSVRGAPRRRSRPSSMRPARPSRFVRVAVVVRRPLGAKEKLGRVDLQSAVERLQLCEEVELLLSPGQVVVAALTGLSDNRLETRLSAAGARVKRIDVYRAVRCLCRVAGHLSMNSASIWPCWQASAITGLLNLRRFRPLDALVGPSTTRGPLGGSQCHCRS